MDVKNIIKINNVEVTKYMLAKLGFGNFKNNWF